ncbi:MAG: hypothetical protein ACXAD7_26280 [Candidatus Kariarchaeaceae archaeon]|jgi:hypothetical protein
MKGKIRNYNLVLLISVVVASFILSFTLEMQSHQLVEQKSRPLSLNFPKNNDKEELDVLIFFKNSIPKMDKYKAYVLKEFHNFPLVRFYFERESELVAFIREYREIITSIEPIVSIKSSFISDSGNSMQKAKSANSIVESTGAKKVHQLGYTGSRVKIGIIDTGISPHEEY